MSRSKLMIGALIVVVVAVVAGTYIYSAVEEQQPEETTLEFTTSPRQVGVSVDGQEQGAVETGDELTVSTTGSVDVEFWREGFETYTDTVEVSPGTTNEIEVQLRPETEEAQQQLEEGQQLDSEHQAAKDYLDAADDAYRQYPILEDLPHDGYHFGASQGLPESRGHDFAIYLRLTEGKEEAGRDAFTEWMKSKEYDPKDYEIVEEVVDQAGRPVALDQAPTLDELEATDPADISAPDKPESEDLEDLTTDELALKFARETTIWDAEADGHHTASLQRAMPMMAQGLADEFEQPANPITSPAWRDAVNSQALSTSWVKTYESQNAEDGQDSENTAKGEKEVTIDMCWAWISENHPPEVHGPRTYELTISTTNNGPRISDYSYTDPDPFVDNSKTECHP